MYRMTYKDTIIRRYNRRVENAAKVEISRVKGYDYLSSPIVWKPLKLWYGLGTARKISYTFTFFTSCPLLSQWHQFESNIAVLNSDSMLSCFGITSDQRTGFIVHKENGTYSLLDSHKRHKYSGRYLATQLKVLVSSLSVILYTLIKRCRQLSCAKPGNILLCSTCTIHINT